MIILLLLVIVLTIALVVINIMIGLAAKELTEELDLKAFTKKLDDLNERLQEVNQQSRDWWENRDQEHKKQ